MANIAQTVNVLQAVLLTDGDRLIRTPTFHVFEMNKGHRHADALAVQWRDSLPTRPVAGGDWNWSRPRPASAATPRSCRCRTSIWTPSTPSGSTCAATASGRLSFTLPAASFVTVELALKPAAD